MELPDFDSPLIGISGMIFVVFLIVLIDNLIDKFRGPTDKDDDDKQRRY